MSSGLPLKADIARCSRHVAFVPGADHWTTALPILVEDRVRRQAVPGLPRPADVLRADAQECVPVCTDNLNAGVAVMKSAQDGT
jgi:hypothetical protein